MNGIGNGPLAGRVALVTGGSNGIGAASVRALAETGATLCVGFNKGQDRAEALIATLPPGSHAATRIALEDAAGIAALPEAIRDRFGRLDVLVNSAGFTRPIPHANLAALDDALFDSIMSINVRGTFSVIRALAPLLRAGGDSVIVNVSSVAAFTGAGSNIAYGASKAALDTMTMSLARVLGPEIRVLCVSPGAVATDFVAGRGRAQLEAQAASSPLRRVVEPEDVALAVLACVTHLKTSTGTRIVVDGGRHL
jgi:3-oxoacyl-[acyl-carrier protein] reductase